MVLKQTCFAILVVVGLTLIHVSNAGSESLTHQSYASDKASENEYFAKMAKLWTPERLRNAKPMKRPQGNLKKQNSNRSKLNDEQANVDKIINDQFEHDEVIDGELPINQNDTQRIVPPTYFITKTVGKLYFDDYFGYSYQCTGSVVTAPSKSLVLTAAHCLYDNDYGIWYSNFIFIPSFDEYDEPYGYWIGKKYVIHSGYAAPDGSLKFFNYDYGFVVATRSDRKKIADVVGSQGISFTSKRSQLTFSFGFPGNIADGLVMSMCAGYLFPPTCNDGTYKGQALRCGMLGGSSGGPWIEKFSVTTGLGYAMGVNSYGCPDVVSEYIMHGPLFDTQTSAIYNTIKYST